MFSDDVLFRFEKENSWYGPDCPDDETIERISKDEEERRRESA